MGDVVFVVLGVGLFLASAWYVVGCERLIGPDPAGDGVDEAVGVDGMDRTPGGDGGAADPAGHGSATATDAGTPR